MRCEIIKDLLPLYCDDVLSDVSKEEVDKHLAWCKDCKKEYEDMKNVDIKLTKEQKNIEPMKKVKKKFRHTRLFFLLVLLAGLLLGTAYEFLCANPRLATSDNVKIKTSVSKYGKIYSYTVGEEVREAFIPEGYSDIRIDTVKNCVWVNDEKLLDDKEEPVPANGEMCDNGFVNVHFIIDTHLTAIKLDFKNANHSIKPEIGFRPCLPFRQNMSSTLDEKFFNINFSINSLDVNSIMTVHCRDKDIEIDLYKLAYENE